MALCNKDLKPYAKRMLTARARVLSNQGFYGLLLMHLSFGLDESADTAYTDGDRIMFSPEFMDSLSDKELDFILMHEVMHVALRHCVRQGERDNCLFNLACDIVVNSNIMHSFNDDPSAITLKKYGESMHRLPTGEEGYNYNAEEVYDILAEKLRADLKSGKAKLSKSKGDSNNAIDVSKLWDNHDKWKELDKDEDKDIWDNRVKNASDAMAERSRATGKSLVPEIIKRRLMELSEPQIDWRQMLNSFVQEEICDYSFTPPDRRYDGSDFFLPDFNDRNITTKKILFMIDTSGSMSDRMVTEVYSEVKGAIDQFDGKLCGWLGFFDSAVVKPKPFNDEKEFSVIKAYGGGGTSFHVIFEYVKNNMMEDPPASIIILTDGYAPVPPEKMAMDIPVLWVINNKDIKMPWGQIARIKSKF